MVVPTMDTLPRVPDAHGDNVNEKIFSDLYIRTTWVDANEAMDQIKKGKARGRRSAIYMRSIFQSHLQTLGFSIQKHAGKVIFVAILILSTFCVGLKSATIHSKVHQLWIQDGGRLETELTYTQNSLGEMESTTHQLIIQTPKDPDASVLNAQALLTHLDVLRQATAVTVQMFDITWSLRDMCNVPTIPQFDAHYIEQIFENIIPCSIITPLDCFWEGSKLLGPDDLVHIPGFVGKVQWTSLNPLQMLENMKSMNFQFPFDIMEQYMKRAGISTGYTEKPCLDPKDPMCPDTAPNKKSQQLPDIGAELTGGCYSYAAKYMHWPEELIVGGVHRNRTGHLKKAKALQTVIQLMTEREMYESWNGHYKVHHIGWSPERAAEVLNSWQKKFSIEVSKIMKSQSITTTFDLFAFSSATLDDILAKYSNPSPMSLGIAIFASIVYAAFALVRCKNPVQGQMAVGIAGVLLIGVSTASGLGMSALLGIPFNAATFQVIPFLALGLGITNIFTLLSAYNPKESSEQTKDILMKAGPTVLLTTITSITAFASAVLIPVPALRVFCLQAIVVIGYNLGSAMLVFPAMISLDLRRRQSGRADFFCCCLPPWNNKPTMSTTNNCTNANPVEQGLLMYGSSSEKECTILTLSDFIYKYYSKLIISSTSKFFGMLIYCIVLGFCLFHALKIQDGLDLYDIVPKGTNEHKFLNAQSGLFGFYNMFAVTQGDFEYPTNQKLLHEYHEAFVRVPHVIKNDNGGLPDFWLSMFRDWLINLQRAFDKDRKNGCITQEKWFNNASTDAILAYKLLVQTGHVDNPIDKSLVKQGRLVDADGIINPKAFYNYLSAWASNDVFSYSASQGKLRPEPRQWYHVPTDFELKIPKSLPLVYTQLPFYLHGLTDTNEIKTLITTIRDTICEKFELRGLPNYPSGIPFIFWEQYIDLRSSLALILLAALAAAMFLSGILLLSFWASVLIGFNAIATLIQLLAVMMFLNIKLSAIPAVILVLSVGLSVNFSVNLSLGFITSLGGRDRRTRLALQQAVPNVIHGSMSSMLTICMLSTSPFEFIVRHFFWLLLAVMLIGLFNGVFFFPILLSLIGPAAELVPLEHPDRISTPSPPPIRQKRSNKTVILNNRSSSRLAPCNKPHHHHKHVNITNEPSLTTISEEPQSWKSSSSSISTNGGGSSAGNGSNNHMDNGNQLKSIVVQPEVTVETTHNGTDQNTKVTATANIKVELVTPSGRSRSYHNVSS